MWYHLQWIIEQVTKADGSDPKTVYERKDSALFLTVAKEFGVIKEILMDDAKNYHAWQYRRWLVDFFNRPVEQELEVCDFMLIDDAFNNSAWNHRFYCMLSSVEGDVISNEIFERVTLSVQPNQYNLLRRNCNTRTRN